MTDNRSEQRPVATFRDATVSYPHRGHVLRNISFSLYPGNRVAVVGPNGAGKTTLFRAMLGLVPIAHGSIELFGAPPPYHRSRVAYVPQREDVDWQFPLTAEDVVMMSRITALPPGRRPSAKDREIVASALARVGMLDLRRTPISQLSGGQQQRVFLARALAQEADLFLLDEPFNEIDAATQELLLTLLDEFSAVDRTVVVATHDLRLARYRFPEVLLLNKELVAFGSAEEVLQPALLEKAYSGRIVFCLSDNNRGTKNP